MPFWAYAAAWTHLQFVFVLYLRMDSAIRSICPLDEPDWPRRRRRSCLRCSLTQLAQGGLTLRRTAVLRHWQCMRASASRAGEGCPTSTGDRVLRAREHRRRAEVWSQLVLRQPSPIMPHRPIAHPPVSCAAGNRPWNSRSNRAVLAFSPVKLLISR
jgi:hypothetical protein